MFLSCWIDSPKHTNRTIWTLLHQEGHDNKRVETVAKLGISICAAKEEFPEFRGWKDSFIWSATWSKCNQRLPEQYGEGETLHEALEGKRQDEDRVSHEDGAGLARVCTEHLAVKTANINPWRSNFQEERDW